MNSHHSPDGSTGQEDCEQGCQENTFIPNTAVFGPTKLIGTIASTMRIKILDENFG